MKINDFVKVAISEAYYANAYKNRLKKIKTLGGVGTHEGQALISRTKGQVTNIGNMVGKKMTPINPGLGANAMGNVQNANKPFKSFFNTAQGHLKGLNSSYPTIQAHSPIPGKTKGGFFAKNWKGLAGGAAIGGAAMLGTKMYMDRKKRLQDSAMGMTQQNTNM